MPHPPARGSIRRRAIAVAIAAALGGAIGAGRVEGRRQIPAPRAPFTVAVNTSTIEAAPVYLAAAGPFGAAFTVINGGVRNLLDNGVEAATNSETQMLLATPVNPRIRMLLTVAEGHYRIIGRKSAGISTLADLRGKRITTALQTSAHYYLLKLLNSAGLQESDVTLVNVDRAGMASAVAARNADAISMWEPEAQKALDSLGGDASVFENVPLYREWFSLYTTTDVLNDAARRRALIEFVRALLAASDTLGARPQEAIPIVARAIGQTEAIVRSAWARHAFPATLPPQMVDVLTEEEVWVAKLQQRAPRTRAQLAALIEPSVLTEARRPAARTP
jgi:NitT/TauT family transport system substrate-binding protein